jgi:hypothetical protein
MTEPSASCRYCFARGEPATHGRSAGRHPAARTATSAPDCSSKSEVDDVLCELHLPQPSIERRLCKFLGNVPKSRCPCRVAGLGHDQGRRRGASQFADSARSIIGARLCFWVRRREHDRSGSVGCRLTKKQSGEIARRRKQAAWTAREEAGACKSWMGGIVPASRVTPPVAVQAQTSASRAWIAHTPSMASMPALPADHRNR